MSTIFHGTSLGNGATTRRGFSTTNLRARLASTEAPPVVSRRGYLRNNMPAVYQDGDFGLRFLESLETTLDPIVGTLDVLAGYFHSTLAPRDVLGLLASWVGLPVDESWSDDRLREALARESEIAAAPRDEGRARPRARDRVPAAAASRRGRRRGHVVDRSEQEDEGSPAEPLWSTATHRSRRRPSSR